MSRMLFTFISRPLSQIYRIIDKFTCSNVQTSRQLYFRMICLQLVFVYIQMAFLYNREASIIVVPVECISVICGSGY